MNQYLMTASSRQKIGQAGATAARILFNIKKWRQSWPTGHARVTVRLPGGGELTPTVRADGPNVSAVLLDQEALEKAGVVRFTVEWIEGEHTRDVNIYEGVLIGEDVEALEDTSHEMGQMSEASGSYAVAEGMLTEARGDHSHTEGLGTIAGSQFQTVLGRYNQVDNDNQYALIIGGGNSDTDRKSIMKVGWDGGLWIGSTEVVQRFAGLIDGAHWAAVLARNIGDMEGRYDQQDAAIAAAEAQHEAEIQEAVGEMQDTVGLALDDYADTINQQNEAIDAQTTAVNAAIGNWESMVTALRNAVEEADLKILNTPNLLPHQPDGETVNVPSSEVIEYRLTVPAEDETAIANTLTYTITDSRLTANHRLCYGITCSNYSVISYSDFTLTPAAGSATLTLAARRQAHYAAVTVTVYIATLTAAVLPYGEISRWWSYSNTPYLNSHANARFTGDERDEISERIVTLSEPIVDQDEATYNKAVAFTVGTVPTSGMNNWDRLIFNHGHAAYEKEVDGQTVTVPESGVLPMVDGMEYTMSCWVRVTSGTKMKLGFSWGMDAYGNDYRPEGAFEYIEVTNTAWKRMYWTFTYHSTVGSLTMHPRIAFGVCRAFAGTVQLAGFRLTAGGLYGNNTVDTIRLQLAALENRVAALEAMTLENANS